MSETAPLQAGIFVPGVRGFELRHTSPAERGRVPLNSREESIFRSLSRQESRHPVSRVVDQALQAIVAEDLGVDVLSPDPRRMAVQRFCINIITGADRQFDSDRAKFSSSMGKGEDAFLSSLSSVSLTAGPDHYSVGEALHVLDKVVSDTSLYPPDAQVLIAASLRDLRDEGIKDAARSDSATLTVSEAQKVKETTNTVYAGLLFDLLYSAHMARPGYTRARERYIATRLAIQYGDDVLDVGNDMCEGSTNIVVAHAGALGELDALKQNRHGIIYEPIDLAIQNVRVSAPQAYKLVAKRQHELLEASSLPPSIAKNLTLPTA